MLQKFKKACYNKKVDNKQKENELWSKRRHRGHYAMRGGDTPCIAGFPARHEKRLTVFLNRDVCLRHNKKQLPAVINAIANIQDLILRVEQTPRYHDGRHAAFTLAEVLITLGIIGIVAALTIPTLTKNYQKKVIETKLKEDYSIIQQAMKFSQVDGGAVTAINDNSLKYVTTWFNTYFFPYIKTQKVCYYEAGCWQSSGPTRNLAGKTAIYNETGIGVGNLEMAFRLANGSNVIVDSYNKSDIKNYFGVEVSSDRGMIILLDVNGDSGPNVIGQDIYALVYSNDGRLVPGGSDETVQEVDANCSASATGDNAGYYCMQRVVNNGWKIPDDVWNLKL